MKFLIGRYSRYFLILFMVIMVTCAGFVQRSMNRARADMGLTRLQPLENAPPVLAFTTVALGGFRGLISNMLWIRATQLQEDCISIHGHAGAQYHAVPTTSDLDDPET